MERFGTLRAAREKFRRVPCIYVLSDKDGQVLRIGESEDLWKRYGTTAPGQERPVSTLSGLCQRVAALVSRGTIRRVVRFGPYLVIRAALPADLALVFLRRLTTRSDHSGA